MVEYTDIQTTSPYHEMATWEVSFDTVVLWLKSHATELINGGVSLPTIRKRLGHKNLQTTLRYAEQADNTADAEIRQWRRSCN
jgi:hypothetical protein